MADIYTLGVEEEYQLVNPQTRELWGRASKVMAAAKAEGNRDRVQSELHRCQIEIATDVCHSLAEVRSELERSRRSVIEAAQARQVAVVAAGTHPFSHWYDQTLTDKHRYRQLARTLKQTIRELIIFGCHVHVGLNDTEFRDRPEMALDVVNRCRLWLSPLLALTANSPFWEGRDTGYDSFRTELWSRLPTAGPPPHFTDHGEYERFIQALIQVGAMPDISKLYWDIRLSHSFPTLEFRIADVCMTIDEAVMLAGLIRALVRTSYEASRAAQSYPPVKSELLKAAHWNAARYGLSAELIDVIPPVAMPAPDFMDRFLDYLRPALEAEGDWETVAAQVQTILHQGNSASRQRQWWQESNRFQTVVDRLIEQTAVGAVPQPAASPLTQPC